MVNISTDDTKPGRYLIKTQPNLDQTRGRALGCKDTLQDSKKDWKWAVHVIRIITTLSASFGENSYEESKPQVRF